MIADKLPRYYEQRPNPLYTSLRSVVIDGHEVAWMQCDGKVSFDITNSGREGEPYSARGLFCECAFTEDVGWRFDKEHPRQQTNLMYKCLYKEVAMYLRQLELRREYVQLFQGCVYPDSELTRNLDAIILDLIEKAKAGEWVGEDGGGAGFWGGYFYLGVVAKIADTRMRSVWEAAGRLVDAKLISLEGAVVQDHRESTPDGEDGLGKYMPIPFDRPEGVLARGYRIKAWQPRNSEAERIMIVRAWVEGSEDGEAVAEAKVAMMRENMFGLDVEDLAALERATDELLDSLQARS